MFGSKNLGIHMISRRSISLIVLSIALCSMSAFSNAFAEQPASRRIACVGDSITFGARIPDRDVNSYPAQLARLLGAPATVMNFGVSGATLLKKGNKPYWGLKKYSQALDSNPDIVIIKLGTNDSKPQNWQYKSDYVSDYVELIESFQRLESQPTVWICYPVPAYPGNGQITDKVIREEILPLIDEVSKTANVQIIDLYSALSGRKELFPDRVHPNAEGAKVMAETIAEVLLKGQKS